MKDRHAAAPGGDASYDFFDESDAFDGERKRVRRDSEPTPNNLTLYTFREPILDAGEERDLIRLAQAGDGGAKTRLAECFHRLVLKIAAEFYGPSRDDLIGSGLQGLSEAVARFDLRRNTRLGSFAMHTIRNAMRVEATHFRKRGQAGETRADRWVYSNCHATAEEVVAKVGCTLKAAEEAIHRADAYWHGHDAYDTVERGYDDDDEQAVRSVVDIDVPATEVHPAGGIVTDDDWAAIGVYRARDALKKIRRAQYQADQAATHRVAAARKRLRDLIVSNIRLHADKPPKSRVERENLFRYGLLKLADEIDKRNERRLREIGRRAYALELVERDRARIEARADPQQYLYPWCRESNAVVLPHPRKQNKVASKRRRKGPKRSKIRVWRSPELQAA